MDAQHEHQHVLETNFEFAIDLKLQNSIRYHHKTMYTVHLNLSFSLPVIVLPSVFLFP